MALTPHAFLRGMSSALLLLMLALTELRAGAVRSFEIEAGEAPEALKQFAKQAGVGIVFDALDLRGVRTRAAKGELLPREALERVLSGTRLVFKQDPASGAFAVVKVEPGSPSRSETTPEPNVIMKPPLLSPPGLPSKKTEHASRMPRILKAIVAILAASQAHAQQAGENVVELSPFQVSASTDVGYQAVSTLAGSRIRTNLGDVATSISVVTKEFMQDTGSMNVEDLLVYTTGTEVVGMGGNYSGGVRMGTTQVPNTGLTSPSTRTRLRGLAGADRTRNYFSTLLEFDAYNTERVEINRGANAALFGLGSPAGIINNILNRAHFKNAYELELRGGSFGSLRASADINQVLIADTLAIRINALQKEEKYQQEGAYTDDDRLYGTVTFQKSLFPQSAVWGKTTVRGDYETVDWRENRPRIHPMTDVMTQWFDPFSTSDFPNAAYDSSAPVGALYGPKPAWNGSTMGTGTNTPYTPVFFVQDPLYRNPVISYENHTSAEPSSPGGSSIGRQGIISALPGVGTAFFAVPATRVVSMGAVGSKVAAFHSNPVITDFSIFDFRDQLIDGPTKSENTDFEAYNVSLEQLFIENKLGIELAFDHQKRIFDADRRITQNYLFVDPNGVLMDGTVNPNFGRAFVTGAGTVTHTEDETEDFRVTAFYELDLAGKRDGWLAKILGRHVFTGLYDDREDKSFGWGGVPLTVNDHWQGIYGNTNSRINANGRIVGTIHYLGDSMANATNPAGAHLPGIQAVQVPTAATVNTNTFRLNDFRDHIFRDVSLSADDRVNIIPSSAFKSLDQIESQALIWQSYFLENLIVGTVSWRKDEITSYDAGSPPVDPSDSTRFLVDRNSYSTSSDTSPFYDSQESTSYGVVVKIPTAWLKKIPGVEGVSFRYNESSNFQPTGARESIRGDRIPGVSGNTVDYGVALELFGGKISLNATWYETDQSHVGYSSGLTNGQQIVFEHGRVMNTTLIGVNQNLDNDPFPEFDTNNDGIADVEYVPPPQALLDAFGFSFSPINGATTGGNNLIQNTQDFVAKGMELEVVMNPTPNWRFMLNATRQESVVSNTAKDIIAYLNDPTLMTLSDGRQMSILDAWSGPLAPFNNVESRVEDLGFLASRIRSQIAFAEGQDGQVSQELRKWRFNAISNYQFRGGRLDGFNVGGAVRWQDAAAIGYGLRTDTTGAFLLDAAAPIYGEDDTKIDFWVGYSRKLRSDKVDWRIQLNLRNVLDSDKLVPVTVNPDGQYTIYSINNGLTWELSSTFRF